MAKYDGLGMIYLPDKCCRNQGTFASSLARHGESEDTNSTQGSGWVQRTSLAKDLGSRWHAQGHSTSLYSLEDLGRTQTIMNDYVYYVSIICLLYVYYDWESFALKILKYLPWISCTECRYMPKWYCINRTNHIMNQEVQNALPLWYPMVPSKCFPSARHQVILVSFWKVWCARWQLMHCPSFADHRSIDEPPPRAMWQDEASFSRCSMHELYHMIAPHVIIRRGYKGWHEEIIFQLIMPKQHRKKKKHTKVKRRPSATLARVHFQLFCFKVFWSETKRFSRAKPAAKSVEHNSAQTAARLTGLSLSVPCTQRPELKTCIIDRPCKPSRLLDRFWEWNCIKPMTNLQQTPGCNVMCCATTSWDILTEELLAHQQEQLKNCWLDFV